MATKKSIKKMDPKIARKSQARQALRSDDMGAKFRDSKGRVPPFPWSREKSPKVKA